MTLVGSVADSVRIRYNPMNSFHAAEARVVPVLNEVVGVSGLRRGRFGRSVFSYHKEMFQTVPHCPLSAQLFILCHLESWGKLCRSYIHKESLNVWIAQC